jgi:hypothetical protein
MYLRFRVDGFMFSWSLSVFSRKFLESLLEADTASGICVCWSHCLFLLPGCTRLKQYTIAVGSVHVSRFTGIFIRLCASAGFSSATTRTFSRYLHVLVVITCRFLERSIYICKPSTCKNIEMQYQVREDQS